uniref:Chromo domain-containing protein n=1 Tax=Strongyloides venezuelensis TaxID=75913 RepID=A0A0K0FUK3_STRVS
MVVTRSSSGKYKDQGIKAIIGKKVINSRRLYLVKWYEETEEPMFIDYNLLDYDPIFRMIQKYDHLEKLGEKNIIVDVDSIDDDSSLPEVEVILIDDDKVTTVKEKRSRRKKCNYVLNSNFSQVEDDRVEVITLSDDECDLTVKAVKEKGKRSSRKKKCSDALKNKVSQIEDDGVRVITLSNEECDSTVKPVKEKRKRSSRKKKCSDALKNKVSQIEDDGVGVITLSGKECDSTFKPVKEKGKRGSRKKKCNYVLKNNVSQIDDDWLEVITSSDEESESIVLIDETSVIPLKDKRVTENIQRVLHGRIVFEPITLNGKEITVADIIKFNKLYNRFNDYKDTKIKKIFGRSHEICYNDVIDYKFFGLTDKASVIVFTKEQVQFKEFFLPIYEFMKKYPFTETDPPF